MKFSVSPWQLALKISWISPPPSPAAPQAAPPHHSLSAAWWRVWPSQPASCILSLERRSAPGNLWSSGPVPNKKYKIWNLICDCEENLPCSTENVWISWLNTHVAERWICFLYNWLSKRDLDLKHKNFMEPFMGLFGCFFFTFKNVQISYLGEWCKHWWLVQCSFPSVSSFPVQESTVG